MPVPRLVTSLSLGALLASIVSAQDAVFLDATYTATLSPNYGKVLRLCYPIDSDTNEVFMAETSDYASCDDYGGGSRWNFVSEPTPTPERVLRGGNKAYRFPASSDYFSIEAPDGKAVYFDSTPETLESFGRMVLGDQGSPRTFSKAIFTTGPDKRPSRYGNVRGRVFPGDTLQFIGSSSKAAGYYKLYATERELNEDRSFPLLVGLTAPTDEVVVLTAAGEDEEEPDQIPWEQRQAEDTTVGAAIGGGNEIPVSAGGYKGKKPLKKPTGPTSRITETKRVPNQSAKVETPIIPKQGNDIITTEYVEEYPNLPEDLPSNPFAEPLADEGEMQEYIPPVAEGDLEELGSLSSLREGTELIPTEELVKTVTAEKDELIGEIGSRPIQPLQVPSSTSSEHNGLAQSIEEVQRAEDPSVGFNQEISEEEFNTWFPGTSSSMRAGMSETPPPVVAETGEEDKLLPDSPDDFRANAVSDIYVNELAPGTDVGVIGSGMGQRPSNTPSGLQGSAEQPAADGVSPLAQWDENVNAMDESVLSHPPGMGNPPRRESFDEIAQQIGASAISDDVGEGDEGVAEMIGVDESKIEPPVRFALSSDVEEPLALLKDLGLSNPDFNTDAQALFESPRGRPVDRTAIEEEGVVPSYLKPTRSGPGTMGFSIGSLPVFGPLRNQYQQEQPPQDVRRVSRSGLSFDSPSFENQPPPTTGRKLLKLSNSVFLPEAAAPESIEQESLPLSIPLLETVNESALEQVVPERVVPEAEERKTQTINIDDDSADLDVDVVDNWEDWNVVTGRPRKPRQRQRQSGQTGEGEPRPSVREPDFWERNAAGPVRTSRNRDHQIGWSQNYGPNGQGDIMSYERG
ncbi:hypothetical protein TWF281_011676 [Arthrobotrys megalospora]